MTIGISIPVHEKQDVVINQIQNIKKYVPNSVVVIHLDDNFKECDKLIKYADSEGYLFINPHRLSCEWGNIIDAHISNFIYLRDCVEFDYIMFHASNDMYILPGVEDYVKNYDAGFHIHPIYKVSRWWPSAYALEDPVLKEILKLIGAEYPVATQIESSFYKKELFSKIVSIIEKARKHVVQNDQKYKKKYTREEVYFSTIAYKLLSNSKIGYPTTYSEVHDFDRKLWKMQHFTWGIYHRLGLQKIIPKTIYDEFEKSYSRVISNNKSVSLTIKKIQRIITNQATFLKKT
ncbi:hypothetical protein [Butyrivibrio sp. AE3003]|uniref:hypothetical protein n=1 Tax=Butyrivibrio sp. AE3003 TaxID=1496721 RepID=UPI00047D2AED|nr:hypothetical protein [Butyrivibrio sp. AE3003]